MTVNLKIILIMFCGMFVTIYNRVYGFQMKKLYAPSVRSLRLYNNRKAGDSLVISSAQNAQVKLMRSLQLKKKREEYGSVVLEGFRHIHDALQVGLKPTRLLISESGKKSPFYSKFQEAMARAKVPKSLCLEVTDEIFDSLSDTVNGQGIIAAFEKPKHESLSIISSSDKKQVGVSHKPLVVVLDGVADPGNAGTILRSAYGLGAAAVIGIQSCDLWAPKVLRASMGCILRFPIFETSWEKASILVQSLLNNEPYQILVADGSDSTQMDYSKADYISKPTILVIGSESKGPSKQITSLCMNKDVSIIKIQIPMLRPVESFNAAVAASIILAEAAKQRDT